MLPDSALNRTANGEGSFVARPLRPLNLAR